MNVARDGVSLVLVATILAAGTFALALKLRSWSVWLAAFVLLLVALTFAWTTK